MCEVCGVYVWCVRGLSREGGREEEILLLEPSVLLQTVLCCNPTQHTAGTPPPDLDCDFDMCLWTLHFTCTSPLVPLFDLYCPAGAVRSAQRGALRCASVPGAHLHLGGTAWGAAARLAAAAARLQVRLLTHVCGCVL